MVTRTGNSRRRPLPPPGPGLRPCPHLVSQRLTEIWLPGHPCAPVHRDLGAPASSYGEAEPSAQGRSGPRTGTLRKTPREPETPRSGEPRAGNQKGRRPWGQSSPHPTDKRTRGGRGPGGGPLDGQWSRESATCSCGHKKGTSHLFLRNLETQPLGGKWARWARRGEPRGGRCTQGRRCHSRSGRSGHCRPRSGARSSLCRRRCVSPCLWGSVRILRP